MMQTENSYGTLIDRARDYAAFSEFAEQNNHIRYLTLDARTVHRLNLFAIREDFDFASLEEVIDRIVQTLPAIKRIFAKPITRLKETNEIMPVESVRVVNHSTIVHASSHSELWEDIDENGMKPRHLLTLSNEDNYAIYENLAFVGMIDQIRRLVSKNIRILRDMLYGHGDLHFNILERENHLQYFLAVGKLHVGYVRDFDQYRPIAERCLNKLLFIDEVIRARLGSAVYRHCKHRKSKLTLKKTNIFRNHKDYHRIYLLLKWFSDHKIDIETKTDDENSALSEGYGLYCLMLTLFAVGHFNFTFSEEERIDFYHPDLQGDFGDWRLKIDSVASGEHSGLRLTVHKDRTYSILLIPAFQKEYGNAAKMALREVCETDEVQLLMPAEGMEDAVYLSLYDIESFRRIQQILLRGMLYADEKREICPFCGNKLSCVQSNESDAYVCATCRTQITSRNCPQTQKAWIATSIQNHRPPKRQTRESAKRDPILYRRYLESQMHFRNITPIGEDEQILCPECGEIHAI